MTRPVPGREKISAKSRIINILGWAALALLVLFWFTTDWLP